MGLFKVQHIVRIQYIFPVVLMVTLCACNRWYYWYIKFGKIYQKNDILVSRFSSILFQIFHHPDNTSQQYNSIILIQQSSNELKSSPCLQGIRAGTEPSTHFTAAGNILQTEQILCLHLQLRTDNSGIQYGSRLYSENKILFFCFWRTLTRNY